MAKTISVSIKDKIAEYQQKNPNVKLENMKEVDFTLRAGSPAIDKLDASIAVFKNCQKLSLSTNLIEKITAMNGTRGIDNLKKLKVLYVAYNNIKKWDEFERFCNLPLLEDFIFIGNPLYDTIDPAKYTKEITKRIPTLKVLEGVPVLGDDESDDD
ncbi:dynein axonemal light chain 1-like [Chrysoperla carnea]|uniref:dynein axonemal light chain 1-like n=1 Tax=Chrysoperla carnea TaxID=189513 RepID=UPI001D0656CC|nr:dynein axonemal light chain 1-like [Chrysoperla carnea]